MNNIMSASRQGLYWGYRNDTTDITAIAPATQDIAPADNGELIARVEAATICSSDIKVIRLGEQHPLFAGGSRNANPDRVLGHELCLRVVEVGAGLEEQFHAGQRLGLQPTIRDGADGASRTVGMDIRGGFAQYIRLDHSIAGGAAPYVFDVPEDLPAAAIAMLEPYACVERAYRPNARREFAVNGKAVVIGGDGAASIHCSRMLPHASITFIGIQSHDASRRFAAPGARTAFVADWTEIAGETFDDIIVCGEVTREAAEHALAALARGGLWLHARYGAGSLPVAIDPAHIHYHNLSLCGTASDDVAEALTPARHDVTPGGIALVHGAGGPMGRMHVHRLLQLPDGPATVVATSRQAHRRAQLITDFEPLAQSAGRRLIAVGDDDLAAATVRHAPEGFTDIVVVAPSVDAVAESAAQLATDGLLMIFAGTPLGDTAMIDIGPISSGNRRITGSTSCSVADQRAVLARIVDGSLQPAINLKAIAGLRHTGAALAAMMAGEIAGKIALYPFAPDLPLTMRETLSSDMRN